MMRCLLPLLLLAAPLPAAAQGANDDRVEALGAQIHAHDQAAWHATDAMLESVPDGLDVAATLEGFIVTPGARKKRLLAAFHDGERVLYEAEMRGAKVKRGGWLDEPRRLNDGERIRIRALDTARGALTPDDLCEGRLPLNHVVLPVPDREGDVGSWYVYFLTPLRALDEAVYGRHTRVEVSADGLEVLGRRSFTRSCAVFPTRAPGGQPVVSLMTSHVLDDRPQETHVFVNLHHGIPVAVAAGGDVFMVERGKIRALD